MTTTPGLWITAAARTAFTARSRGQAGLDAGRERESRRGQRIGDTRRSGRAHLVGVERHDEVASLVAERAHGCPDARDLGDVAARELHERRVAAVRRPWGSPSVAASS